MTPDGRLRVLLIEAHLAHSTLALAQLADQPDVAVVDVCSTLAQALDRLDPAAPYDAVLAGLPLPDADGPAAVAAVLDRMPQPALVVLASRDDPAAALAALASGAQDYLVKGRYDGRSLATAVRHAVQRTRAARRRELALSGPVEGHPALHDPLTGLPTRLLLADRLSQALRDTARRRSLVAVALLDLDDFRRVNDSLGRASGDRLLAAVADRLRGALRAGDVLARGSGDEFVVVWRDLTDAAEGEMLSERLSFLLAAPFDVGAATVAVSAGIGMAVGASPQSADELLRAADSALYEAKGRGRGRLRVFTRELHQDAAERMATETGLRDALADGALLLHYQPVVDLRSGRPVAVEALLRWQHQERGLVPAEAFIRVAETSGLVVPLGRWALDRACRDAAAWIGQMAELAVAVNLSVRELTQPDVLPHVQAVLADTGLDPGRLLLEVTESAVREDAEAASAALGALVGLGVRVAIDDFGTGYRSLLYLRRYPVSALKVDRALVAAVGRTAEDTAIVTGVVNLAHAVGATSIAEGVETPDQHAALRALGCRQAQGRLFSPPVPEDGLPAALHACQAARASAVWALTPEQQSETIGRIRALHAQGASLHTIAAALNREGAPHPQHVRWHSRAVARVIGSLLPAQGAVSPATPSPSL